MEFVGKHSNLHLSFPSAIIDRYYSEKGPINLLITYPDMTEGSFKSDDWISISVRSNSLFDRKKTLDTDYTHPYCETKKGTSRVHKFNEEKFGFKEYIYSTPASLSPYIIYQPIAPKEGLHCITCIGSTTCTIHGITGSGIAFQAISPINDFTRNWKVYFSSIEKLFKSYEQ